MSTLSDSDFDLIVSFLEKLPERTDPSKRKQCWQTADELLSLFPPERELRTARELDAALCNRFLVEWNSKFIDARQQSAHSINRA